MSTPRFRVLLIEDRFEDARLIELLLSESRLAEFELVQAERLAAAIELLKRSSFDLVLLDLTLPDSLGLETFERLYQHSDNVPIVILTGLNDEELAVTAVQKGAQDYLIKGADSEQFLARTLQYAIQRFRASEELRQREEHLRLLTQQLPCLFWTTDQNLVVTSSPGIEAKELDGLPMTLLGQSLPDFFGNGQQDESFLVAHRQAAEGMSQPFELRWRDRLYQGHVEPFRGKNGRVMGTIGVALDVTDRAQAKIALEVICQVQQGLFPKDSPNSEDFDIAGTSYPADEAGGDFFCYIPWPDGAIGVAISDVGGHGLGPAMLMAQTRAYLRAMAQTSDDLGRILTLVNRFLCSDGGEERLVALFLAKFVPTDRVVHYAGAGHLAHLLRGDGSRMLLKPAEIPLNINDETTFAEYPAALDDGDIVLMYTDGVVECANERAEMFGTERMLDIVEAVRHLGAQQILDYLFHCVRAFGCDAKQADDMTAVLVKVRPR